MTSALGAAPALRILVVDDEPDIARLVEARLAAAGFAVEVAHRGSEALAALQAAVPDIAFLDISMPDMTGMEILDWIHQQDLDMAVVMMTAHGSEQLAVEALRRGADDYLRKPFSAEEFRGVVARTVSRLEMRRQNACLRRELVERAEAMERQSLTDALTGLANRRAFDQELERLNRLTQRGLAVFGLLMADVDWFKQVNDSYGHQVGDEVLQAVGQALVRRARATDMVARMGGEEFAVLLPGASPEGSAELAMALRKDVESLSIRAATGPIRVTISLGVSHVARAADIVAAADAALYRAKGAGRNRVEVSWD